MRFPATAVLGLAAGTLALSLRAPAWVTVVEVVPSYSARLLLSGSDSTDVLSYDSCLERVMGTTFDQNAPQRAAALDDPYQWCPQRPPEPTGPPKSAPARYVVVVATARAPEPGALRAQLAELNLRQPVDALARELGPRVAASSGEVQF